MSILQLDIAHPAGLDERRQAPALRLVEGEAAAGERESAAALIAQAERAVEHHEYAEAVAAVEEARPSLAPFPELGLRALFAEAWARMSLGHVGEAVALLERARALAEQPSFSDLDRAEALYRL